MLSGLSCFSDCTIMISQFNQVMIVAICRKEPRKQQVKKLVAGITIVMMIMAIMRVIMISTGCGFCGFWTKKNS